MGISMYFPNYPRELRQGYQVALDGEIVSRKTFTLDEALRVCNNVWYFWGTNPSKARNKIYLLHVHYYPKDQQDVCLKCGGSEKECKDTGWFGYGKCGEWGACTRSATEEIKSPHNPERCELKEEGHDNEDQK